MSDLRQPPEARTPGTPAGARPTTGAPAPADAHSAPDSVGPAAGPAPTDGAAPLGGPVSHALDGRAGDTDGVGERSPVGRLAATVERLRREVRAAHAEADGRALIEMAKGILVERLGCGPAQAARQLAELAGQAGVTPLEFAVDVINQAARDRLSEVAADFLTVTAARTETSGSASVRLRAAESGALAANDTQAVADALLEHALVPLGAEAVAIWALGADGSLTLAAHAGFTPAEAGRWRHVPPGVATVARRGLTEREGHWIHNLAETGLPSIGQHHHPEGGRAAVPAGTGGRIHGVLEIAWPAPLDTPAPAIVRQVEALAELCGHTLETYAPRHENGDAGPRATPDVTELMDLAEGLHDPALVLVPHLDADGNLVDFRIHHVNSRFLDPAGRPRSVINDALLLEAYPMVAGHSELFERIERVFATGEPYRAHRMRLTSLVDDVSVSAVADFNISRHGGSVLLIWRIEDETARLASLLKHAQRLGRIGGFEENLLTGEITWNGQLFDLYGRPPSATPVPLEDLAAHAHPDDAVTIGRFLRTLLHHRRPASTSFRLQRPDGVTRHIRVVAEPVLDSGGEPYVLRGAYQDISAHHWTEVALAATRDQLAHTEQQASERNRLTLQLQHAIMPPAQAPLEVPGLDLAVRYRPAETQNLVGGDWYDAVVLPSGLVLLCVGDVAGHGIEAATSMVVLRNALRGLAVTGAGPGQLLSWLNMVTHHLTGSVTATAVCGLYDPGRQTLRWARAGHLPPVLVRGPEAEPLPLVQGLLLGAVPEAAYQEHEVQLAVDDTLLMYTDGLIERRDRSVEESLAQLVTAARTVPRTLEQRLDRLLTHSRSDTDDDTCIVGIRVAP